MEHFNNRIMFVRMLYSRNMVTIYEKRVSIQFKRCLSLINDELMINDA